MTSNTTHIITPTWLPYASGAMNAAQYRHTSRDARELALDAQIEEMLGAPAAVPPMVYLDEDWDRSSTTGDTGFTLKRAHQIGTTLQLLTTLRLCATFGTYEVADALSDAAAITVLDVGHPDWISPVTRAMQDLLPEHTLLYAPDEERTGELLILSPQPSENLGIAKDAARFASVIGEALEQETPFLMVCAGHRALPDATARILPSAIRLAPLDADLVLALLHLRFEDGDAGSRDAFRTTLQPANMLARLGLDAVHAAFRAPTGLGIVQTLANQAAALVPPDGPTLEHMTDDSEALRLARQIVADLRLSSEGKLAWSDCQHSLLLHGKPGTGKTYLARAMGGSSGVPIIMSSFARWQSHGHLGDCLRAMIETFNEAIAAAPCILFIDEIDAAGSRDSDEKQNRSYRRQVINGFLEQIDVAMRAQGVMLVGACNDVAALDPAILRPGRFDSICEVPLPGRAGVRAILERQLRDDLHPSELDDLVTAATGSTPAAIDGAIRAARSSSRFAGAPLKASNVINRLNNGAAPDRTLMWRIAIHECGHAITAVQRFMGNLVNVRLGTRDGHTLLQHDTGVGRLRDHKKVVTYTLAGRAAESIIFGSVGSGSGGQAKTCDLAIATQAALAMETSFGFGTSGLVWSPVQPKGEIKDPVLRAAVRRTLDAAEAEARHILENHRVLLLEMAKDLMRHRILEGPLLQLWVDRITGDAPWNPDDPSGKHKASERTETCAQGEVVKLADYRSSQT